MLLEEYRVWVLLRGDFTGCSPILSSCFDHEYQFIRQSTGSWTSDPVVGWFSDFVAKYTTVLPLSAWLGANLLKKSDNLPSWKGLGFSGERRSSSRTPCLFSTRCAWYFPVLWRTVAHAHVWHLPVLGVGVVLAGRGSSAARSQERCLFSCMVQRVDQACMGVNTDVLPGRVMPGAMLEPVVGSSSMAPRRGAMRGG